LIIKISTQKDFGFSVLEIFLEIVKLFRDRKATNNCCLSIFVDKNVIGVNIADFLF